MPVWKQLLAPPNPEDIPDMCPLARFMMEAILEEHDVPPPRVFTVDNIIRTIIDQDHSRRLAFSTVVVDNQASSSPPRSPYQQTEDIKESLFVWGSDRIIENEPVVINQTLTYHSGNYGENRSHNLQFPIDETPLDCTTNQKRIVDRFDIIIPETLEFSDGSKNTVNCDYLDDTRGRLQFKENEKSKPEKFETNNYDALNEICSRFETKAREFQSVDEKDNTQMDFFIPNSYFGNQFVNRMNKNPYITEDVPQAKERDIIKKVNALKSLPYIDDLFLNRNNTAQNHELIDLSKNINDRILFNNRNLNNVTEAQQLEEELDNKVIENVSANKFPKSGNSFLIPVQDHDEFLSKRHDDLNLNTTEAVRHSKDTFNNKVAEDFSDKKSVGNDNLCLNQHYPIQNQDPSTKIIDPPLVNPNVNTYWNKHFPQNESVEGANDFVSNTPNIKFVLRKKKMPGNKDDFTKIILTSKNLDKSESQILNQNDNPTSSKFPDDWIDSSLFYDDETLLKQDNLKLSENVVYENFNFSEPSLKQTGKNPPKCTNNLKRPLRKLKREGYVLEISKEKPTHQPKLLQSKITDLLPVKKSVNVFKSEVVGIESDFQKNTRLIQNDLNVIDPINCSVRKDKVSTDNMLNRIVSNVQNKLQKFKFNHDEAKFDKNKKYDNTGEEVKNSNAVQNKKESTDDCRPEKEHFFEEKISNVSSRQLSVEEKLSENSKEKTSDDNTNATLHVISANKEEKVVEKTFQGQKFTKIWQQNKSFDRKPIITMSRTARLQTDEEMLKRKFDEEMKNKNTVIKIKRAKFLTPVRRTIEKKD